MQREVEIMRYIFIVTILMTSFLCSAGHAQSPAKPNQGEVNKLVPGIQEKMMADKDIMALVYSLQNDPEMQEILNDPAVVKAVSEGDTDALLANPHFIQLLNNPHVREIQQRIVK
jgi:hypothetical protein